MTQRRATGQYFSFSATTPTRPESFATSSALLPQAEAGVAVRVDAIPSVQAVDGCTLAAVVGRTDVGVELTGDGARAFRCSLRPESWRTVAGLIEPFTIARCRPATEFQYLTDAGSIDWIISTSRQW
jgi:hypothetical protein